MKSIVAKTQTKKILIVEDQGAIALNICDRLKEIGYDVAAIVTSGEKAIAAIQTVFPDLVLMDIEMTNGIDGIQAAQTIRETAEIPVVFLTAHSDRHTIEKARHSGAYGYVTKPFQTYELLSTIETALARYQIDQQNRQREHWLATTLSSIGEGVITTDLNGMVTYMNPKAVEFTGHSHAFAKDQPIYNILSVVNQSENQVNLITGGGDRPFNSVDQLIEQLQQPLQTKPLYLVDRNNRSIPIEINITPIKTNHGQVNGAVFVLHDASAHLEVEANLRRLVEEKTADIRDANYLLVAEINERRRVEEILFRHLDRLEKLYQMVFALGHASNPKQIYTTALAGMQEILAVSRASLMIENCNGAIYFQASQGIDRDQEKILAQSLAPAFATNLAPQMNGNEQEQREFCADLTINGDRPAAWQQIGINAIAYFTLIHQNKLLGRILIYGDHDHPPKFEEEEIQLGKTAANFIAMAIARTNAVAELRQSEEKFRSIYNQAAVGIAYNNLEGDFELVNQSLCQILGYSEGELKGQNIARFIHQEDFAIYEAYASDLQRGQLDTFTMESRFVTKEEQVIWCNLTMSLLLSSQGNPENTIGIFEDISDRKLVEATIRERMAVVTHAPVILWKTDKDGMITLSEGKGLAPIGYMPGELEGVSLFSLEDEFPEIVKQTRLALRTGEPFDITIEYSDHILKCSGEPTVDNAGKVNGIIGVSVDISDRISAEKAQNELEKEKQLSETRIQFFSMASHEFRTPLATILGTTQILETATTQISPEKLQRNISRIKNSASQINRLLTDILTINRAETGKLEFLPQPIDLLRFCQHLIEEAQIGIGIEHVVQFDRQNWQASDDTLARIKVYADEQLLRSILNNLLSNAVKYSPSHSKIGLRLSQEPIEPIASAIATTTSQSGSSEQNLEPEYDYWAVFQVSDEGRGISPADQSNLFNVFFRGKNVERVVGSGIGLTVVKKCADIHGGKISVQSELGKGTTFTVKIPVKEVMPGTNNSE